jgi:outer membrane biosynthesis protein TonB
MAAPKLDLLKMPSDANSEIFFNSNTLSVDFRKRDKAPKQGYQRQLRVVVQAYGQTVVDKFFKPGSTITFGVGKGSEINVAIPNLSDGHPLLTYQESGSLSLRLGAQFSGIVQMGDKLTPVSELKGKSAGEFNIEIPNHPRGAVEQGTLRIYFEEIDDPERLLPLPFLQSIVDREFGKWLMLSLALHLLLLLLIKLMPAPVPEEEKKVEDLPKAFQKILVQPQEVKPYKPVISQSSLTTKQANNNPNIAKQVMKGGGREGEGARAPGAEGRRGRAEPGAKKPSMEKVKNAGVLNFFAQGNKNHDLVDGSVSDLADNLAKSSGGRFGLEGETEVRQGKGLVGSGSGGGGKTTSIGQGLGTKGRGAGIRGDGLADFGTGKSRTSVTASIDADAATVVGSLSKDQIAKVIAAYMGQIEYCYERQLQKEPNLRGKILVHFVIGLSGAVTSASTQSSSMGSPTVESCINGVFRRMPFPSPGAGIVEATYPLVFNVAG